MIPCFSKKQKIVFLNLFSSLKHIYIIVNIINTVIIIIFSLATFSLINLLVKHTKQTD